MAKSLELPLAEVRIYRGRGCLECNQTGYRSRVAISEIFLLDEKVQDMVSRHSPTMELRQAARDAGMRTLRDSGWEKVHAGLTAVEEVTRVTGNLQLEYNVRADGS